MKSPTTYLLDVNLLLALSDPMHVHHEIAHQWFADRGYRAWATCPLTENGFVRIASHPNYPNRPGEVLAVFAILRQLCEASGHQFWAEDISILDILEPTAIITHAQPATFTWPDWLRRRKANWPRWIGASRSMPFEVGSKPWKSSPLENLDQLRNDQSLA